MHGQAFLVSVVFHGALLLVLIAIPRQPAHPQDRTKQEHAIAVTFADALPFNPAPGAFAEATSGAPAPTTFEHAVHAQPSRRPDAELPRSSSLRGPTRLSPVTVPSAAAAIQPSTLGPTSALAPPPGTTALENINARGGSDAEAAWERLVLAQIEQRKRYPARAQRAGQHDTVYVRVAIDRSGQVLARAIHQSKGIASLDAAALGLVERSSPLPPPPPDVEGQRIEFIVPVEYHIRGAQ